MLQFFFLHHQVCGRSPRPYQQAGDIVGPFDGGRVLKFERAILDGFCGVSGLVQGRSCHLDVPRPQQKPPATVALQLVDVQLLKQAAFVDDPNAFGQPRDLCQDVARHENRHALFAS